MEAFARHPRIGGQKAAHASAQSSAWSSQEQSLRMKQRTSAYRTDCRNALYEQRFGFTYIVCATGKSAEEMLAILNRRLAGDRAGECARPRSSSGRSHKYVWESGLYNECDYYPCAGRGAGKPARAFLFALTNARRMDGPSFERARRMRMTLPRSDAECRPRPLSTHFRQRRLSGSQ